jgi:hypothetical protein
VEKVGGEELLGGKDVDLIHEGLQNPEGTLVGVDDHIDLEPLVLASEEGLLVLVLALGCDERSESRRGLC